MSTIVFRLQNVDYPLDCPRESQLISPLFAVVSVNVSIELSERPFFGHNNGLPDEQLEGHTDGQSFRWKEAGLCDRPSDCPADCPSAWTPFLDATYRRSLGSSKLVSMVTQHIIYHSYGCFQ